MSTYSRPDEHLPDNLPANLRALIGDCEKFMRNGSAASWAVAMEMLHTALVSHGIIPQANAAALANP